MTVRRLAKRIIPRKRRPDPRTSFMAGGIVVSLLLLAFVLQRVVPADRAIVETLPPPEFTAFLPAGASQEFGEALELPDLPQPSYAVAFSSRGTAGLALVEWDRETVRYADGGSLTLEAGPALRLAAVESMTLVPMGTGEQVIAVRGRTGAQGDGVFLVSRGPDGLAVVRSETAEGGEWPAFWFVDDEAGFKVTFEDTDGDGRKEVVHSAPVSDGALGAVGVWAWRWQGGALAYDKDLSAALTISKSLFPEPPAPAAE